MITAAFPTTPNKKPPNILILGNKQAAVHPEEILCNKNEQNIDTSYNMDRCQMHCVNQKTLKGHLLYDSIYMTLWQKQSIGTKNRLVIIKVKGKKGLTTKD